MGVAKKLEMVPSLEYHSGVHKADIPNTATGDKLYGTKPARVDVGLKMVDVLK